MSKLEEQKALPRRKLFRLNSPVHSTQQPKIDTALAMDIGLVKRKRAKKAKGKR